MGHTVSKAKNANSDKIRSKQVYKHSLVKNKNTQRQINFPSFFEKGKLQDA